MKATMPLMVMVCSVDRINAIEKLSVALCRVRKTTQEYTRKEASDFRPKTQKNKMSWESVG